MAPTKIARRSTATAPIAANNRRSSSKLPIAESTGRKSLLRPRSSFGLTKLSKPAKGGIVKARDRKDVSSSARNILQEKGFKLPAPVTAAKKSVRFKESSGIKAPGRKLDTSYPSKVVATQRNPFETAQNVGKELKDDKTSSNTVTSQFGENFVFEEDPAALASILNNEGVSASLLQKTQIDEAKKEGKTADEFLLLPDGRPSLCRRIPRNRSSVIQADGSRASIISSRVSAGPVRVARISNVATGRTSFANPKRGSVIRTSTRNSLYNMIDKRYSQHGNENAPPANTGSRASFINTGKGKKPSQSDITTKPTEEELQKSAARRVLRPKIEENLACASPVLRVPAVPNPLTCSPAMRIRSGRKALKKSALTDKQASNSPKIKDNVAVALFQDEENSSPLASEKATLNPTKKKSLSRLRPVSQIHAKSASQYATTANPKQGIQHNKDKSKTGIGKIEANEHIIQTKFLKPQLSPGEQLVQPKVLNASDDTDNKTTASSDSCDMHSAAVASQSSVVKPHTINATKPSSLGVSKQLQRRPVSKLPTRKSKMKSNVDPNQVLEIMYKKLARIKRRSVRDEFTSVVESVEMSLACSTLVEEEEETDHAVGKGKVPDPEPPLVSGPDQESLCQDAACKPARTEMRPWREVLAAESTSPTWRDLLSKESKSKLPAPRPAPAIAKSVGEGSPEVDTRRTLTAIPTRSTGQKVAEQMQNAGTKPPAKSDEDAAEVSKQLRLTYEESLRQMQLAEAENRRIEEEMKRLQLEKLSLQERNQTKGYEKPARSTSASINKMMHMKNRLMDILDSKIDIPCMATKKQPDTRSLQPPTKYFNPIVSPEMPAPVGREIVVTKAETLPPTKGVCEVEEKQSPNMLKPKSANAFSWEKEKYTQGKITSGRIGHAAAKVTPDRNAEKCKIEAVISPKDEPQRPATALPAHQQKHTDRTQNTPPANLLSWDPSRSKIPDATIVSAGSSATAGSNCPGGTQLHRQKHTDRTQNTPPPANLPSWDPSRSVLLAGKVPDASIVSAGSSATTGSNCPGVTQLPKFSTWSSPPQRLNQNPASEPSLAKITDSSLPGPVSSVSQPIMHASSGHAEVLNRLQGESLLKNHDVECRQPGLPGTFKDSLFARAAHQNETDAAVLNPAVTVMAPTSNAQAYKPGSTESGDLVDKMHNNVFGAPESLENPRTETKKSSESEARSQPKSVSDSGDLFKDITCETPSWLTTGLDDTYNWLVPLASKPSRQGQKSTVKSSPDTPSLLAAPDRFNSHSWLPGGDKLSGRDENGTASKSPLVPSADTLSWITKPQFACLEQAAAAKLKNDTASKSLLEPPSVTQFCLAEPQFACMEQTKSAAILEFLSKNSNANHISEEGFSKKPRAKVDENCNITKSPDIKAGAVTHYEKQTDLSLYHANMSLLTPCGRFDEIPGFSPLSAKPSANLIDISFAEGLKGEAASQHNPISRTSYSTKPLTPVLTDPKRPDGGKIPVADTLQSKTGGLLVDLTPVDTDASSLESKGRPKPGITPVKAVRFHDASSDIGTLEKKKLFNSPIKPTAVGYLGAPVAPKPLKPPPPQTPAAFRMLRQKFRNSPTPKKTRPRSPFSMQSPSRGVVKSSKKKSSILTSSPYMRSACTRRFAEALLDEEVALFTCRNLRTPITPRRRGREMATANPLGRVLLEGDEKHFIPLSPIMRINKPAKSNVVIGSAFSAFSQGT